MGKQIAINTDCMEYMRTLPPVIATTSVRGISRKTMMVCGKIGGAKRCFVTRPTGAKKPDCGRKNVTAKDRNQGQRWCC